MNSCILITSHLNNDAKIKIALDQLKFLKENTNLPIIYVGNYVLPTSIQELADYSLCIKENPTTISNRTLYWNGRQSMDYGYAHLHQQLLGASLARAYKFEYLHHLNYDVILEKEHLNQLIEVGNTGEFQYHKWGANGISTAKYSIKSSELTLVLNTTLHYYYNENPPNLGGGFIAESFFKWAVKHTGLYESLEDFSNIPHKLAVQSW
jgi:hypothetical protein